MTSTVRPQRLSRGLFGGSLALAGALMFGGVMAVSWIETPICERLLFRLGLTGATLLSGLGQVLILVGGWLVWTAIRRTGRPG